MITDNICWANKMIDRVIKKYYWYLIDPNEVENRDHYLSLLRNAKRQSARKKSNWLDIINDLVELLPDHSVFDTSSLTYWHSYSAEIIPFQSMSSEKTLDDFEPILADINEFMAYNIAVSALCPIYHLQPFRVYKGYLDKLSTEWIPINKIDSKILTNYNSISCIVDNSLRSYGYQPIPSELLFKELHIDMQYTDNAKVKDLVFGSFTFGELPER